MYNFNEEHAQLLKKGPKFTATSILVGAVKAGCCCCRQRNAVHIAAFRQRSNTSVDTRSISYVHSKDFYTLKEACYGCDQRLCFDSHVATDFPISR